MLCIHALFCIRDGATAIKLMVEHESTVEYAPLGYVMDMAFVFSRKEL